MDRVLRRMLSTDWLRGCSSRRFCFRCESLVCSNCCSQHTLHHAGPPPAQVGFVRGASALRSQDTIGCGYSLDGIQRLQANGYKWIPIDPPLNDDRYDGACFSCGGTTRGGTAYCCMGCKRANIMSGGGRRMVLRLINSLPLLGLPVQLPDRMCRFCVRVFSSVCCPDNMAHHNGNPNAAALGVMTVLHQGGWPLVNAEELPDGFADGVQVQNIDGQVFYPIHRRPLNLGGGIADLAAHPCEREDCWESIPGDFQFCSLQCRHHVGA